MQCIIMENTLIKLLNHDETKKRALDSQIVRAKENLKLSHGGSILPLAYSEFTVHMQNLLCTCSCIGTEAGISHDKLLSFNARAPQLGLR